MDRIRRRSWGRAVAVATQAVGGRVAVLGRLVEYRNLAERLAPARDARALGDLEGVEAAAAHEQRLIAQHLADRAQLAPIAVACAQQARVGVGAAVAEAGELERDHLKAVQLGRDLPGRLVGAQPDAARRIAPGQGAALGKIIGPAFGYDQVVDAVETIVDPYLEIRADDATFNQTLTRVGFAPFKEKLYAAH